jgi:hypothetical protein
MPGSIHPYHPTRAARELRAKQRAAKAAEEAAIWRQLADEQIELEHRRAMAAAPAAMAKPPLRQRVKRDELEEALQEFDRYLMAEYRSTLGLIGVTDHGESRHDLSKTAAREAAADWKRATRQYPKANFAVNLLGYDADPREIWDIADAAKYVRRWARAADIRSPGDITVALSAAHRAGERRPSAESPSQAMRIWLASQCR